MHLSTEFMQSFFNNYAFFCDFDNDRRQNSKKEVNFETAWRFAAHFAKPKHIFFAMPASFHKVKGKMNL